MKMKDKLNLTDEQIAEVEKKETRNEMIALGVTLVMGVGSYLLNRKLAKDLEKSLYDQAYPENTEEVTEN